MKLVTLLPIPVRRGISVIRRGWRKLPYLGRGRDCPVCGRSSRRFASFGRIPRQDAMCIHCNALERHRLLWLFLQKRPEIMRGGTIALLHVAPEACLMERLRDMAGPGYVSADLMSPRAMERIDICDIDRADASFDAIYCSHVLEHVHDDRKAMHEFHRVLRPDGWAILMVPKRPGATYEDPSITTPAGRLAAFGQEDHVRFYGDDFVDRLGEAGFDVRVFRATDLASPQQIVWTGLSKYDEELYFCRKRGFAATSSLD